MQEALRDGGEFARSSPDGLNVDTLAPESPADRILRGIEFRTKGGRQTILGRLNTELERMGAAMDQDHWRRRDEREKAFYQEIEHLKNALELEQARHRADIIAFASGRNPMHGEPEASRKFRPALGV